MKNKISFSKIPKFFHKLEKIILSVFAKNLIKIPNINKKKSLYISSGKLIFPGDMKSKVQKTL